MAQKIWVTSDTHFNHVTMIREQWRPFATVEDMNTYIINNWNNIIMKDDVVYHLGDIVLNRKRHFDEEILPKLNGKIIFIKGNHDKTSQSNITHVFLNYFGKAIQLVHNPNDAILSNSQLIIHGHVHNNGKSKVEIQTDIKMYNANLEFHKYKPKLLSEIVGEVFNKK